MDNSLITFYCPKDLKEAVRAKLDSNGMTLTKFLVLCMRAYIKQHKDIDFSDFLATTGDSEDVE